MCAVQKNSRDNNTLGGEKNLTQLVYEYSGSVNQRDCVGVPLSLSIRYDLD